jgi:peptide deformylase
LSTICEPVRDTEFGSKLEEFASQLLATMNTYKGIGLAAPQVGVTSRVFIMHFPESAKNGKLTSPPLVMCNPTLQFSGPTVFEQEGCLSFPSLFEQVGRQQYVVVRYFTVLGEEREIELKNMDARVAAHEAEHLDGIMFFDRRHMSKQVRKALLRKWDKIKHQYDVEQQPYKV